MISVAEARGRIVAALDVLPAEIVGIDRGFGRVLAADVTARRTQPPHAVSAMDGWAVRSADLTPSPATLKVAGSAPAGHPFAGTLKPGEAVRIFTGAVLPAGSDSIVIQEDAEHREDGVVVVPAAVRPGTYVREAGLDFRTGDVLLKSGRILAAREIGLAAAMNVPWLSVRRRPRVALLATGDELVRPGEAAADHQIFSSNALAMAALVRMYGGEPIDLGIALDNRASLTAMAEAAAGADLLVTLGGVSVGDHDLVRAVLGEAGLDLDFWQIAMRPGKPLMFGRIGTTAVLGMPGNPVSSLICGIMFFRPAIRAMLGLETDDLNFETAILGGPLGANDRREDYLRATARRTPAGTVIATPFSRQDSSMLRVLADGDCLIVRQPHAPAAMIGEAVSIIRLEGLC